ncbi:hypothetical protein DMJ13_19865 [halophilic archaeon]|nr:hypothetical protein DMJ13_19865 [halophilic archaeon]
MSLSLYYVGGAAVVTLVVLKGGPAIRSALNHGDDQSLVSTPSESDAGVPSLELYQSEGCPYCQTVRRFCTRNGLSLIIHNPRTAGAFFTSGRVRNKQRHDELIAHGKDQIPLLVDTERDEVLYESDDIIAYLKTHYI